MSIRSLVVAIAAVTALAAPGMPTAQPKPAAPNPARATLATLDRQADALFAAAAKRDWTGAQIALDGAKGSVDALRTNAFVGAYADAGGRMEALYAARHRLDTAVAAVDIAIGAADGASAMQNANRITEAVWQLGEPINPAAAQQTARLASLARQLEYARAVGDKVLYAETVARIRQTWAGLRPQLAARKPAPHLKALDDAVARLGTGERAEPEVVKAFAAAARSLRTTLGG